jgi:hypothetical protein
MNLVISLLVSAILAGSVSASHDVVVYGGTAGGAIAAIAAAGEGERVVLIEPGKYIGGMVSGGLGRTDFGNQAVIGGLSRDFFLRLGKHYGEEITWYFEPHVAEQTLRNWLAEAGVQLEFGSPVESVAKDGALVTGIRLVDGRRFSGTHFIDASYEGDLMARAGVSYTWGREAESVYGESLAGTREFSDKHQFEHAVNPFGADGKLLPLIQDLPLDPPRTGDRKVQAYNFRLCMTKVKENRVPFPKPEGYDPARWDLFARYLAVQPDLSVAKLMNPLMVANGKTDTNNNGPISTDYIGGSWEYPEADYARRAEIWEDHKRYVQGVMYFLQNDPRVPKALHEEMAEWGLAKDEFTDNANWPHQLYVREARRMVGDYVMRQRDLQDKLTKPDSIGMGSYNSDSHHVQRIMVAQAGPWGDATPRALNEGDMQVGVRPYEIAYRSITPKREEATNLFVTGAFSASHVAYSSMRMEPQYMILGHAAGVAAAQARARGVGVQQLDVAALQTRLREQGAILGVGQAHVAQPAASFPGIVVDSEQAEVSGKWRHSSHVTPYVGLNYLAQDEAGTPGDAATFRATLPKAGQYDVRIAYTADPNRSADAQVELHAGDVREVHTVNMRRHPGESAPFLSLGVYTLPAGESTLTVRPGPKRATGLIADAAQWLPVAP